MIEWTQMDFSVDLLRGQHLSLGDLFACHQEALVDRRWAEAARLLEEYGQRLLEHIDFEERHLLPRCDSAGHARWPAAVYRAEHRRIEQLLRKAADRLTRARGAAVTSAVLITLLDEERTLKRLLEHHHEREEQALFMELSAASGADLPGAGIEAAASKGRGRPDA